jgi:hypothetical protein
MPEVRHIYRQCAVCGKSFQLFLCRLESPKRQGMFCTQACHRIARTLFRRMLEDGRLAPLLKAELAEVQKEGASKSGRWAQEEAERSYAAWQRTSRTLYKEASRALYEELRGEVK